MRGLWERQLARLSDWWLSSRFRRGRWTAGATVTAVSALLWLGMDSLVILSTRQWFFRLSSHPH